MNKKFLIVLLLFTFSMPVFSETTVEDFAYYQQQVKLQRYPWNMSGFIKACMKGDSVLTEYYIKGGMNVNQPYMDSTPLIMAIYSNDIETVEILLKNSADPNLERATLTPLHLAIRRNNPNIVNLLIKYNVNVNQECKNTKPINFAIQKNNYDIVKSLINAGAQIDEKTKQKALKAKDQKIKELF